MASRQLFPVVTHYLGRLAALTFVFSLLVYARILPAQERQMEFLLLEVRLEQAVLSEAIPAYGHDGHTMLPLGELARLLTLAIQTDPDAGTASGFILDEERGFSLNLADASVTLSGASEAFDPALALAEPDDLYIAASLLERWLPLDLEVNRSRLSLQVHPREELPLQERLRRERLAERIGGGGDYQDPGYPRLEPDYSLLDMPFIDQTLATELRQNDSGSWTDTRYTAFLTGDLLGMESSIYFNASQQEQEPDMRVTLGRHDPEGGLLGPLHARSFSFGSISAPSVEHISQGLAGEGITLSNRPLTQPTSFDQQTFEGDLAPGWDVELYYNDALVGYQQASAEGRYRFEDQPLSYGRNDFRLVFNGPLGQTRVESYSYSLDEAMVKPGEFQYSLTEHRDEEGQSRSVAQFDMGISRSLSATAGFARAPVDGVERQYSNLGLRTFWRFLSLSGDLITDQNGGSLSEFGLKTRIGGMALDANRALLDDFDSDVYYASSDPIKIRDEVRLTGAIPLGERTRLPVTLEATREERESGYTVTSASARLSAYIFRTALTHTLRWRSFGEFERSDGTLQLSRRFRDLNLRSQANYTLGEEAELTSMALSADQYLTDGYRMSLGVVHSLAAPRTVYTAGFTKSLGRYGLGLNASYSDDDEMAVGAQLFVALGRNPQRSSWLLDARPMAGSGAVSARMFLDENANGIMDSNEMPIEGAGFTLNGGRHQARTDAAGVAHIGHLPVKRRVDIGVDVATLGNPQWAPQLAGVNLLPRPGHVTPVEFPVRMTSEIDGTVYLKEDDKTRGIGDIRLELLNEAHEVVAETISSWDGFYIVPAVMAGDYLLRISPGQLNRLQLSASGVRRVNVSGDGTFVSGMNFTVSPASNPAPTLPSPQNAEDLDPLDNRSRFRTEPWINDQRPGNFTIQLVAAGSEIAIQHYLERHHLTDGAAYFRTQHNGKPWFTIVFGNYASFRDAQAALGNLPTELAAASPWLRRYEEVQEAIQRYQDMQPAERRSEFQSEDWVLAQPPENHTIQLMAARSEGAIQEYIEHHGLKQDVAYIHTQRDGLPWFSVLYGSFADFRDAQAALNQLPEELKQASPWLRKYRDVQSALPGESWIEAQRPANFAIQLMAVSSESAVQRYIERHELEGEVVYFRTEHRGSPWYSVVYGNFTSLRDAQAALEGLPSVLKSASPWVRSYGDIQNALKARQ